jgi:hypothetical protein
MFQMFRKTSMPSGSTSLSTTFLRLGWIGFWIQVALGAIPLTLMIYGFIFGRSGTRSGLPLLEYLTTISLLILAFTTIWFFRYTRLAKRLADPQHPVTQREVQRTTWIGVFGGTLGLVFSMLVMLAEVTQLLFYFLRAPQAGVPVIQTASVAVSSWVSAVDIVSLLALIIIMFGELVVLIFSLWLLFRTVINVAEFADTGE